MSIAVEPDAVEGDLPSGPAPVGAAVKRSLMRALPQGARALVYARSAIRAALRDGSLPYEGPPVSGACPLVAIPSTAVYGTSDRVLAELDHDGFAFAVDPLDEPFFNRRSQRRPRSSSAIHIIAWRGLVCVRKRFLPQRFTDWRSRLWRRMGLPFNLEAAALLLLRGSGLAPELRDVDRASRTLIMDWIHGPDLRHMVAETGAIIHDVDLIRYPAEYGHSREHRDRRESQLFRARFEAELAGPIGAHARALKNHRVIPGDVKLGNIVMAREARRLYWIDLESATLAGGPGWDRALRDLQDALEKWFGPAAAQTFAAKRVGAPDYME